MADIKQAAKWMAEGKRVTRLAFDSREGFLAGSEGFVIYVDNNGRSDKWTDMLEVEDLLAEDWEIAP